MTCKAKEHPDYPYEKDHLNNTILAIKTELPELINSIPTYTEGDTLDQHYANKGVSRFRRNRGEGLTATVLTEPYFGRLDIDYGDSEIIKLVYIGKVGFSHNSDVENEFSICDWKAEIANLYYEGAIGQVTQGGETCEIKLRRQFEIRDAKLLDFFEEKLTEQIKNKLLISERQDIIADPILLKKAGGDNRKEHKGYNRNN